MNIPFHYKMGIGSVGMRIFCHPFIGYRRFVCTRLLPNGYIELGMVYDVDRNIISPEKRFL